MKITESRYGYSEAGAGFSIVFLVILLSGYSIGAHSEVRFPFYTRDTRFRDFSSMMGVCRNSFFYIKKLYSKNTNGIESCLILSASNNYLGLNTFIIILSIYCHLRNNFYSKVIVLISFANKLRAR